MNITNVADRDLDILAAKKKAIRNQLSLLISVFWLYYTYTIDHLMISIRPLKEFNISNVVSIYKSENNTFKLLSAIYKSR